MLTSVALTSVALTSVALTSRTLTSGTLTSWALTSGPPTSRALTSGGADIDFSCWPLWCGSLNVKIDRRIFCQLAYHLCRVIVDDDSCKEAQLMLGRLANYRNVCLLVYCDFWRAQRLWR